MSVMLLNTMMLQRVFKHINSLDILVNNAGTNRPEHFTKIKKEDMNYVVDLNIKAAFHMSLNWEQK